MQNAARYREFAETLTTIAEDAPEAARELILSAAMTWRELADAAEPPLEGNLVDFARAKRRRGAA